MAQRKKRAHITPDGEALIIAQAIERPRMQRTKLAEKLRDEFENEGWDVPEVEVLERKISWYRNHAEAGPLEQPWSMAKLEQYPLPTQAIPAVLKVWKLRAEREATFTIREAKWAARLSGLIEDIPKLSFRAGQYARTEMFYQFLNLPFDSTDLDRLLMGLPMAITGLKSLLPLLAEEKGGMDQLRSLKQGKRKNLTLQPFGENAISDESPSISRGLARELSDSGQDISQKIIPPQGGEGGAHECGDT